MPAPRFVDICNTELSRRILAPGRLHLSNQAYPYSRKVAGPCCVVDPAVGCAARAIIWKTGSGSICLHLITVVLSRRDRTEKHGAGRRGRLRPGQAGVMLDQSRSGGKGKPDLPWEGIFARSRRISRWGGYSRIRKKPYVRDSVAARLGMEGAFSGSLTAGLSTSAPCFGNPYHGCYEADLPAERRGVTVNMADGSIEGLSRTYSEGVTAALVGMRSS